MSTHVQRNGRFRARGLAAIVVGASIALLGIGAAQAQTSGPGGRVNATSDPVPAQYIVTLRTPRAAAPAAAAALTRGHGGKVVATYSHALSGYTARMTDAQARQLSTDPSVASVEQDGYVHANATASWGLDRIDQRNLPLDNSYTTTGTGAGVTAYVIDTGIRTTNTDFGGRAAVGVDEIGDGWNGQDCYGHGTHVAGTIGGTTYGVAKAVSLVSVRVLDCNGSGTWSQVIAGIDWVTANHTGPSVANMSLGGGANSAVDTAVANSVNSGVTYAIAAGNSNANACNSSPARAPSAITVGATEINDARASYSNFGTCVDLFAPGSGITSDWNTSDTATNVISGTSMATPHVTGSAALYLGANPKATPAQVTSALKAAATTGKVTSAGNGSPNLLDYVGTTDVPPTTTTSTTTTTTTSTTTTTTTTTTLPAKPPSAPTVSGSSAKRAVKLSWTAPAPNGSAITTYTVYRSTSASMVSPLARTFSAATRSLNDTGLVSGTTYYYQVSATNGKGEGPRSSVVGVKAK